MPTTKSSIRPKWKEIPKDKYLEMFQSLESWQDLASFWEIPRHQMAYHAFVANKTEQYSCFRLPRRYRGYRKIEVPSPGLKYLQRLVHESLSLVYRPHRAVHGFVEQKSIITNAKCHVNSRFVVNLDLLSFFPSITGQRIQKRLEAKPYALDSRVANVITVLATNPDGVLPQGSPCSPVIANMIASKLDSDFAKFVAPFRARYTRYADDITISTKRDILPPQIARYPNARGTGQSVLGDKVIDIIEDNGFRVNHRKTRVQNHSTRQMCTGLIVNGERVSIPRSYERRLRSLIHHWSKGGWKQAAAALAAGERGRVCSDRLQLWNHVRGKLDYVVMVRGSDDPVYRTLAAQFEAIPDHL